MCGGQHHPLFKKPGYSKKRITSVTNNTLSLPNSSFCAESSNNWTSNGERGGGRLKGSSSMSSLYCIHVGSSLVLSESVKPSECFPSISACSIYWMASSALHVADSFDCAHASVLKTHCIHVGSSLVISQSVKRECFPSISACLIDWMVSSALSDSIGKFSLNFLLREFTPPGKQVCSPLALCT